MSQHGEWRRPALGPLSVLARGRAGYRSLLRDLLLGELLT